MKDEMCSVWIVWIEWMLHWMFLLTMTFVSRTWDRHEVGCVVRNNTHDIQIQYTIIIVIYNDFRFILKQNGHLKLVHKSCLIVLDCGAENDIVQLNLLHCTIPLIWMNFLLIYLLLSYSNIFGWQKKRLYPHFIQFNLGNLKYSLFQSLSLILITIKMSEEEYICATKHFSNKCWCGCIRMNSRKTHFGKTVRMTTTLY